MKRTQSLTIGIILLMLAGFIPAAAAAYDAEVYDAQKRLRDLGYNPGEVDGVWGGATRQAIEAFQRAMGIPDTGELDLRTRTALGLNEAGRGIQTVGQGRRLALVIGNGAYDQAPLKNPVNDAEDMAGALRSLGFEVTLLKNADQVRMEDAIRAFGKNLQKGGVGLFFFAGHGMQVNGRNYLIPVNSRIHEERDIKYQAVDAGQILDAMYDADNGVNIVLLDACRDNPFARSFRSSSRGLARMDAPTGSYIAYATAPGQTASDGTGRNGTFSKHLLHHMDTPGLKIEDVLKNVRVGVMEETAKKQVPWEASSMTGDFYFKLASGKTVVEGPVKPAVEKPGRGSLMVKTEPSGAYIMVGGVSRGRSPARVDGLEPGQIEVKASLSGHRDAAETVWIRADRETDLTLYLDRIVTSGSLTVRSEPSGARWYLDGAYAGLTPDSLKDMKQGTYRIEVKKDGCEDWTGTVSVTPGREEVVEASLRAVAPAGTGRPGDVWTEPITGMEFVWVPGGCYQMGCGSWTSDCDSDEKPVHEVCVDGFWMAKYEVTQGEWQKMMGNNPSGFKKGDNYPVEQVSWHDAVTFIEKLNQAGGGRFKFRLPTEAEWEYAARSGGKDEKYAGGSDVDRVAWYDGNSGDSTHPVGTKAPNGLGIYDMSGNVWEWCQDWFSSSAYSQHNRSNPIYNSGGSDRVRRSGGWYGRPGFVRSANRFGDHPDLRNYDLGFRLVRTD